MPIVSCVPLDVGEVGWFLCCHAPFNSVCLRAEGVFVELL